MTTSSSTAYAALDRPEILSVLFHPRKSASFSPPEDSETFMIPVEEGLSVGACLYGHATHRPTLLFFHGNGETVPDYDDLGPLYNQVGLNLLAVDYRGYGISDGLPSVETMMKDCHTAFTYCRDKLAALGMNGSLFIMGRSLGSASAIELATACQESFAGLIIESGFARSIPLLRLLGAPSSALEGLDESIFDHIGKIGSYTGPLLVIHAAQDHIIPHSDGEALHAHAGSTEKEMVTIPSADHNTLFYYGMETYMTAMIRFTGTRP